MGPSCWKNYAGSGAYGGDPSKTNAKPDAGTLTTTPTVSPNAKSQGKLSSKAGNGTKKPGQTCGTSGAAPCVPNGAQVTISVDLGNPVLGIAPEGAQWFLTEFAVDQGASEAAARRAGGRMLGPAGFVLEYGAATQSYSSLPGGERVVLATGKALTVTASSAVGGVVGGRLGGPAGVAVGSVGGGYVGDVVWEKGPMLMGTGSKELARRAAYGASDVAWDRTGSDKGTIFRRRFTAGIPTMPGKPAWP